MTTTMSRKQTSVNLLEEENPLFICIFYLQKHLSSVVSYFLFGSLIHGEDFMQY